MEMTSEAMLSLMTITHERLTDYPGREAGGRCDPRAGQ